MAIGVAAVTGIGGRPSGGGRAPGHTPLPTTATGMEVPEPGASDEAPPPGWRRGAPGPLLHRDHAVQVWTGTELVVWGGDPDGDSGAAYDPAEDEWRTIAAAPIPARCQGATAWTGREVLVWGPACRPRPSPSPGRPVYATAGAAYDPTADRWRTLPPGPISGGSLTGSVWTGDEWILIDPLGPTGGFDPATDRWRTLAPSPRPFTMLVAHWTGREVVVLGTQAPERGPSVSGGSFQHWAAALDPEADVWRMLPPPPLELAATGAWDGRRLIAWDQNLRAAAIDPAAERTGWERLPDLPVEFADCSPQGTRLGAVVLAEQCGQGALWRPRDGTWERISHPKSLAEVPVWTGQEAVFWVGRFTGSADGVWLYRPPAG